MKKIAFTIILFTSIGAFAQLSKLDIDKEIQAINKKIESIQTENNKLKYDIKHFNSNIVSLKQKLVVLEEQLQSNTAEIQKTNTDLSNKITNTETNTTQKFALVDNSLSKNSLWSIIGILLAILFSGLLYWLVNKRQNTDKTDLIDKLSKTKSSIEGSLVKEFGKQTELMETQLLLIEKQKSNSKETSNIEPDHSLALKLASEINLIERNINLMDAKTKGLRQLQASVGKLKDNLLANGYEMPVLLGKPFNQGMKVIVTSSIPDENLEKNAEVISKVLIPQVNYNDKMIQTAQIEVSVGY